MGTHLTFASHAGPDLDAARFSELVDACMAEVERLEALMSSWRPDSEVSRLNQAEGRALVVSPETFEVIEKSVWAAQISKGTFDITFQVLSGLWRFGDASEAHPKPPDAADVKRLKGLIDYRRLKLNKDERSVQLGKGQQVGLGGIAKGYIVDAAANVLKQAGVKSFLVQAGGDLYGAGRKPDGSPWVSGIQDPRGKKGEFFATIELEDRAFSTAGDYARAYVHEGRRYHHIIDPRTGYPATASRSVTVWAKTALLADAIDDGIFILGPEEGLKLIDAIDGAGAVIVDENNKLWLSDRLKGKVRIAHPPTP